MSIRWISDRKIDIESTFIAGSDLHRRLIDADLTIHVDSTSTFPSDIHRLDTYNFDTEIHFGKSFLAGNSAPRSAKRKRLRESRVYLGENGYGIWMACRGCDL